MSPLESSSPNFIGLLDNEDENTQIYRNFGTYSSNDTTLHPRSLESQVMFLLQTHILLQEVTGRTPT